MNEWTIECWVIIEINKNAWMHECMNACTFVWMYGHMHESMNECMKAWMSAWKNA